MRGTRISRGEKTRHIGEGGELSFRHRGSRRSMGRVEKKNLNEDLKDNRLKTTIQECGFKKKRKRYYP